MSRIITLHYSDDMPASPRWRRIEHVASADRRSVGCRFGEPCDPASLISLYDVDYILDTYERYEHHFGRSLCGEFKSLSRWSGVLMSLEDSSHLIMLNPDHTLPRRRLTLAHEFGHLAFGHTPVSIGIVNGFPQTRFSDEQEREAYGFALALLLPYAPILQMLRQRATPRAIAHHYGTSVEALRMRLKTVGLWGLQS